MVTLRTASSDDIDAITKIYHYHVQHGSGSFEITPPTFEEMTQRMTALLAGGYPYLVATQDGTLMGYAYAGLYRPRAAYRDTVENSVYVAHEHVGNGIGSVLLSGLIKATADCGFRQMIAVVGDSANIASIRLHEKQGFRLVGTLRSVGYKHGLWLDTVLLQLGLRDADTTAPSRL